MPLLLSVFAHAVTFAPFAAGEATDLCPVVAVLVSQNTENNWSHTSWTYFSIYQMFEEVLKSDGTPFVEVSGADVEAGKLLISGSPKYPILFSLADECISDVGASQIETYASRGGFVYVSSSSWTKYLNGCARTDFALSAQMGLQCSKTPPDNWAQVLSATRISNSKRLVDHVPFNVSVDWFLPLTHDTVPHSTEGGHYAWKTQVTTSNPAEVLMTMDGYPMLATKTFSKGRFIYHSELAPLAGYGTLAPDTYEYVFFRRAIEWAFETFSLPLTKLSAWQYQYDSAFVVRHDIDNASSSISWIESSAQRERQLGVTGQYYIVTGEVRDAPNSTSLIYSIINADNMGAQIGSHNGGYGSAPWTGLGPGAYKYYTWGPDDCIENHPGGKDAGVDYANESIRLSKIDLEGWLGQNTTIWVSPHGDSCFEESLQILESLNIKTASEQNIGPYPHRAISMMTKSKYYDTLVIPTSEWISNSGTFYDKLEEYPTNDLLSAIDFYCSLGGLISMHSHVSSSGGIGEAFVAKCLSEPDMWNATPLLIRDWWLQRESASINPAYNSVNQSITVTITGAESQELSLEIAFPVETNNVILQVLLDGVPSNDYRMTSNGTVKIKTGLASKVTMKWKEQFCWTQTTQEDFESGALTNLDTTTYPGQIDLAHVTLFSDTFTDPNWTAQQWTILSGRWNVNVGEYIQSDMSNGYMINYAGGQSWTDYTVEASAKFDNGTYGAQIAARVNTTSGARYSLWTYPVENGPNKASLVKFTNWTAGTELATAIVTTDNDWHTLKLTLNGSSIACFYDGTQIMNAIDSSYSSGVIDFETYASDVHYDWVTVKTLLPVYCASGTLVSIPFDASNVVDWGQISWTASTPPMTQLKFRTRTAMTLAELNSALWSEYYTANCSNVTSPTNEWIQYEVILSTNDTPYTPTLHEVEICYTLASTRLFIDPELTEKGKADLGNTFNVNVTIENVDDLKGFDFNLTWNPVLITLVSVDFNTALDKLWGSGNWFVAVNKSDSNYYKLAVVSILGGFTGSAGSPIAKLTFRVEGPLCNSIKETTFHFIIHKLSNSEATQISHSAYDGVYRIIGPTPSLELVARTPHFAFPNIVMCRTYGKAFEVNVSVNTGYNIIGFEFEIQYNTTLLDYIGIAWNAWTTGTIAVDENNGTITGSASGTPKSGNFTMATVTYRAGHYRVWKDETRILGWKNNIGGKIFLQRGTLSYTDAPDLRYEKGSLNQIIVGPDFAYIFSPIQGDVNNNGTVDILDLYTEATYYDVREGDPMWTVAATYDLNGDGIVDIFDLRIIAWNHGYVYVL